MQETTSRPLPGPLALLATLTGAITLVLAFPEHNVWWLAPVGVALMLWAVRGQRPRTALLLGFVGGLVFYLIHVLWSSEFLGPIPWAALAVEMALWWMLGHGLLAVTYRRLAGRFWLLPVAVAGVWTAREAISSVFPYGGFAWGRLAQSQSASPLAEIVSWVGLSGLSFAIAWFSALVIELVLHPRNHNVLSRRKFVPQRGSARVAVAAAAAAALLAIPNFRLNSSGTVRILAVQGDTPGASYFIPSKPGEIMVSHASATAEISPASNPDLILWPEGSIDVSPFESSVAADWLTELTETYDAPLLANTVTRTGDWNDSNTRYYNTQFVWTSAGAGPQYDKAHPIPFGEYVPNREFFELLAPDLVGMVQREYSIGTRPNTLQIDAHRYGVFICYDIVDDALVRRAVADGSEVLLAPTNNADFGYTDESAQQLATARLRAIESGRSLVQASTVGWTAAYAPDGTELAAIDWYTPGAILVDVPITTGTTAGIALGQSIELLLGGAGLVLTLAAPRPPQPARGRTRIRSLS